MTITFDLLPVMDWNRDDEWRRQQDIADAWSAWLKECCVERHRGHAWVAELCPLDDGGTVDLSCAHCPAGVDDLYPDGFDLIVGEVRGIPITNGRHRSLIEVTAPVSVDLRFESYYSHYYGVTEYDVWIEVSDVDA